jgi:hypothetical protein
VIPNQPIKIIMKRFISLACVATCGCLSLSAAETSQWKNYATLYFLGASMDGTAAIGPAEFEVDLPFSDIADNLEFGAMFNYRGEKDKVTLGLDVIYMGLGGSALGLADIDYDQWMVEGNVGWKVNNIVELFGGVRYNDVSGEIVTGVPALGTLSRSEGWYDPIIGTRLWIPLKGSFSVLVRGDVGGFGVGSELTWQAGAYLRYTTASAVSLILGYRVLDIDYESGEGASRFVYDMMIKGPALGVAWQF